MEIDRIHSSSCFNRLVYGAQFEFVYGGLSLNCGDFRRI
jgi:hypothetical protein